MRSRRPWWLVYGGCAAVVAAALVWITIMVVGLERAEIRARTNAAYQEALRLALWRMDSWLAPQLAQEAARPYFDYQPFYSHARAYTALLSPIQPGEVLTPSPLLSFQSPYFSLHFQMGPDGRLTSPQAPVGNFRELARDAYLTDQQIVSNSAVLDSIGRRVSRQQVAQCGVLAEEVPAPVPIPMMAARSDDPSPMAKADEALRQQLRTQQEAFKRAGTYKQAIEQQRAANVVPADRSVVVGSFVPLWSRGADGVEELLFARSVLVGERQYYQGFLCDWPKLRSALLAEITDLFTGAGLVPVEGVGQLESGTMLATIPVALVAAVPVPVSAGFMSPARATLALAWIAVLVGLVAVAVTLRASIDFGRRRARFASAVTHELRTPLTTFRMYSEMLADGMVTDEEQRNVYLQTLKGESGRLSSLVENVLAYARLEEGRRPCRAASTTWGVLLDEVLPPLRQRAEGAGIEFDVDTDADRNRALTTDIDAVGQILLNLVDNACKYAADGRAIGLTGRVSDGTLTLCVRDHGPGVPEPVVGSIFDPFERGALHDGDGTPGVGLGLALARGLARDLGGDLTIDPAVRDGACFTLTLPVS